MLLSKKRELPTIWMLELAVTSALLLCLAPSYALADEMADGFDTSADAVASSAYVEDVEAPDNNDSQAVVDIQQDDATVVADDDMTPIEGDSSDGTFDNQNSDDYGFQSVNAVDSATNDVIDANELDAQQIPDESGTDQSADDTTTYTPAAETEGATSSVPTTVDEAVEVADEQDAAATQSTNAPANETADKTVEPQKSESHQSAKSSAADSASATVGEAKKAAAKTGKEWLVEEGVYVLESALSNPMVLRGNEKTGNIDLGVYTNATNQKWYFIKSRDYEGYYLIVLHGNHAKAIELSSGKDNANVRLGDRSSATKQLWTLVKRAGGSYALQSLLGGNIWTLGTKDAGSANGTNVVVNKKDTGNKSQQFYALPAVPQVTGKKTIKDGLYEVRVGSTTTKYITAKTANLTVSPNKKSSIQMYFFEYDGEGFYKITVLGTGKKLATSRVSGSKSYQGNVIEGLNVIQCKNTNTINQRWAVERNDDGTYSLINKASGLVLTLSGSNLIGGRDRAAASGRTTSQKVTLKRIDLLKQGIYEIKAFSDKTLNIGVTNNSSASTAKIALYNDTNVIGQRYQLVRVGGEGSGIYRIRTAASGGWLTVQDSAVKQIGTSKTAASAANKWEVCWNGNRWSLRNLLTSKVLGVAAGKVNSGSKIGVYKATGNTSQHFVFSSAPLVTTGYYTIRNVDSKALLGVQSESVDNGGNIGVDKVRISALRSTQQFKVARKGQYYAITDVYSYKSLAVAGSSKTNGANVNQQNTSNTNNQLWDIRIGDGGTLVFVNVNSKKALTENSSKDVKQTTIDGSAGQGWKVVSTTPKGWLYRNGHWKYRSNDSRAGFEIDLNQWGGNCGHYDIVHDIWKKVNNAHSMTEYLIATSWDDSYVSVFKGKQNNWEPLFGWNCATGLPSMIEEMAARSSESGYTNWRYDPAYSYYLAMGNVQPPTVSIPADNAWAYNLNRTYSGSRIRMVNSQEQYFTSINYTLGYHTYLDTKVELGKHLSYGCVRLDYPHAQWIYENIYPGTRCLQIRTREYY